MTHLRRALVLVPFLASSAAADSTPQTLPFSQDWSNTSLITADDDWSGVPGIEGFKGAGLTSANDIDPQTVIAPAAATDTPSVFANKPSAIVNGGVIELELADPSIALQGSSGANAPHIVLTLDTTGVAGVRISYNVRDLDSNSDNAVQQVALQYRVGASGDFTNVPDGYVADATEPNLATKVTAVSVVLPAAVANQSVVQIRIITTNASGSDEWVGIDDISVVAEPTPPTATGTADPTSTQRGGTVMLTANVTPGTLPTSMGITVTCDLTEIGGSATQAFVDDGTGGDVTADDNVFTYVATVDNTATVGAKTLPCTVADTEPRRSTFDITLTVEPTCGDGLVEGNETCDDSGTTPGDGCSDTCMQEDGYTCTGMPSICMDNDECAAMTDECDALATCMNTAGSYTCDCPTGYSGDGTTSGTGCTDIDECADANQNTCDENATCSNNDGAYTCACNAGYSGDGMSCADDNECSDGTDNCDANATCTNTAGGFTCACAAGYSGDGTTCMPDCGDGIVVAPETCDDGDMTGGDGCSANCTVETGYTCTGEPSTCTKTDTMQPDNGDGGGCCSSSTHPGSSLLLAMFVMVGLLRRQRR